jgi:hypothetical protein
MVKRTYIVLLCRVIVNAAPTIIYCNANFDEIHSKNWETAKTKILILSITKDMKCSVGRTVCILFKRAIKNTKTSQSFFCYWCIDSTWSVLKRPKLLEKNAENINCSSLLALESYYNRTNLNIYFWFFRMDCANFFFFFFVPLGILYSIFCRILGILFPESPFSHFRNKHEQVLGNKIR